MIALPAAFRRRVEQRPNLAKIVGNIGWLFSEKILRIAVGLFVGVWVARYLGPEQFGLLNFALAFGGLFSVMALLGLRGVVVREIVHNPSHKHEILGTAACLQLAGGLVAYGCILATVFWLRPDDPLARLVVAIVGARVLYKAAEIAEYWFESQVQSKYTVWVKNSVFLGCSIIKVILILKQAPLIAFAWVITAEALIGALLMLWVMNRYGPPLFRLTITLARLKQLFSDSWPLFLSGVAITVYMQTDKIMLGQLAHDQAVGIYSAATRISEVWYFIPMTIVASVFPAILEARKRSEQLYNQRFQRLYALMVWLSLAVAIPMTVLSGWIITLLFGAVYAQAGTILAIHIWASIFVFLGVASSQWFLVENLTLLSLQRTAFGAGSNVILNFLLIPYYGAVGAAVATVISYSVAAMFSDVFQSRTHAMFFMKLKAFNPLLVFKLES